MFVYGGESARRSILYLPPTSNNLSLSQPHPSQHRPFKRYVDEWMWEERTFGNKGEGQDYSRADVLGYAVWAWPADEHPHRGPLVPTVTLPGGNLLLGCAAADGAITPVAQ